MNKSLLKLLPALVLVAAIGCGKKSHEPAPVSDYTTFTDEVAGFSVRHPKEWAPGVSPGKIAAFYERAELRDVFIDYQVQGRHGGKVEVGAVEGDQQKMNELIEELKGRFEAGSNVVKNPESATVNGMQATKVTYTFDVEDTKFTADRYYIVQNGMVSWLETAVVGDYAAYKPIFDAALNSFKPATAPQTAAVTPTTPGDTSKQAPRDSIITDPPQEPLKSYSGSGFSIGYPANFGAQPTSKGVKFVGARNDSEILVDIVGKAEGTDLAKLAEANKKAYRSSSSQASVGGQPGIVFNYSPTGDVQSRAYFTIAKGNVYRITLNWYKPQESLYLPVFSKSVASFRAN